LIGLAKKAEMAKTVFVLVIALVLVLSSHSVFGAESPAPSIMEKASNKVKGGESWGDWLMDKWK
jgi:hypothetical protein